jgi:hypothetical protein
MKTSELIGTKITNTGNVPSKTITNVLPANNKGHFRTNYNYVVQLDNNPDKLTVESLNLPSLPKDIEFN